MKFVKRLAICSIFLVAFLVVFSPTAFLQAQGFDGPGIGSGGGLVPCGNDLTQGECNFCHLIELIRRIFRFLIYLAAPLVTVLIAFAGIRLMVNADNEGEREKAKTLLKDALIGFLIMILAGFIVNLILGLLVRTDQRGPNWWWGGDLKCENVIPNLDVNYLYIDGTNQGVSVVSSQSIDYTRPMGSDAIRAGVMMASQYDREINKLAEEYGIPAERIKAVMVAESSGRANAESKKGAVGLMQLLPSTAKEMDEKINGGVNFRGLSDEEVKNKLKNNTSLNIQLGVAYYSEALKKSGEDFTRASAFYNGGPRAIAPSRDCPGLQAWQCKYDSPGCFVNGQDIGGSCTLNQGYAETRTYTQNINTIQSTLRR